MWRKLTINVAKTVFQGFYRIVGRIVGPGAFGRRLVTLGPPDAPFAVARLALDAEYRAIAADAELEREAREWIEFAPGEGLP